MDSAGALLIAAWREVARGAGLQETLDTLAPQLAPQLPAAAIWVRALDAARRSVDTLGASGGRAEGARDTLEPREWERLLGWARGSELLCGAPRALRQRLGAAIPAGASGELLAGPLARDGQPMGLALFAARRRERFSAQHLRRAQALLEPLGTALASEQRLHDAQVLREAAEADRRALLSRLGRRDIGEVVVGAESGLSACMERVALVADSDLPVLLLGETGSGKEVVARALRARSRRRSGPFLRVNCGAIAPGLIDSELFGHERGSFSGATGQRRGWFERADGGTLFLDEVGELPPAAQVRLLRVLQDGSFERVGGEQTVHVDVRVIAATHRDLRAMSLQGQFREDLWYRLAVFPIQIPPLRERPGDIAALSTHFALRACERFGSRPLAPSGTDLELLVRYEWPGNVRELAAVLDRAVILGGGERLEVEKALGTPVRSAAPARASAVRAAPWSGTAAEPEPLLSLDQAMAAHIEAALRRCRGQVEGASGAAHLLQINPHTLRARMRKLGIDLQRFRGTAPEPEPGPRPAQPGPHRAP